jgi:Pycsar effector protein
MDSATSRPAAELAPATLPDQVATFRNLDPAAALAFRTPLQEHAPAADTKAAAILTALGIMLTLLARYGTHLTEILVGRGSEKIFLVALLIGFAGPGLVALIQAFRTISPRFPPSPPSLAFFADIARLTREEYVDRVGAISHEEALEQILIYNHTLARICVDKFRHLGRGVRMFRWAFTCWLVLIILVNLRILF